MGQLWNLVCMDRGEVLGCLGKMGELLFDGTPDEVVRLLTCCEFKKPVPLSIKAPEITEVSTIESLPLVVQRNICVFLETLDDVFCFAFSSRRFLEVARQSIAIRMKTLVAPWAGKRLICVGDCVEDYPEGFLTDHEKAQIADDGLYDYADNFRGPVMFSSLRLYHYDRASIFAYKSQFRMDLFNDLTPATESPPASPVLRNLTTKEYIRSSAVPDDFNFGHIVLLQACWSSSPWMSLHYSGKNKFHRGPWAGHRFDITSPDYIDNSWTDVSNAIVSKIAPIVREE